MKAEKANKTRLENIEKQKQPFSEKPSIKVECEKFLKVALLFTGSLQGLVDLQAVFDANSNYPVCSKQSMEEIFRDLLHVSDIKHY